MLEVVYWHQIFDDAGEDPEGLFLGHDLQEPAYDEVEALTVADVNVAIRVRSANPLDCFKDLLTKLLLQGVLAFVPFFIVLKEGFVREGPGHVHLDLMSVCRRV